MSEVSVIARLRVKDGLRERVVEAMQNYFPQVESERDTLVYAISTDQGDRTAIWVYEVYKSQEAVKRHGGSAAFKALGSELANMLDGAPELHFCTPVQSKGYDS